MNVELSDLTADVTTARQRVIAAVADVSEARAAWQPAPDAWSVAQVMEHLVLAEQSGIIRMWQAADGVRQGAPVWQGEAVHRGKPIETIIAGTWREREIAPPNATPQTNGPL